MARTPDKTLPLELATLAQFLKGWRPERDRLLDRLGIATARNLLFFFPRDYQDLTDLRGIDQLEEGPLLNVLATVGESNLPIAPISGGFNALNGSRQSDPPGFVLTAAPICYTAQWHVPIE